MERTLKAGIYIAAGLAIGLLLECFVVGVILGGQLIIRLVH